MPDIDTTLITILIVDDLPTNLQVLGGILRRQEYQIAVATGGQEALDMVPLVTPDLILLDVMMPEMDGFEVCRRLKSDPQTADIPVIFLTARNDAQDIVTGFEAGAVDYVTKPFNATELLVRVRTHLQLKLALQTQQHLVAELQEALARVKQLSGMLPICAHCKKIRDDQGYWNQIETYIRQHSDAEFSHGICPACARELYPELFDENE